MNTLVRSLVSQGCCEVDGIGFDDLICTDNIINFFFTNYCLSPFFLYYQNFGSCHLNSFTSFKGSKSTNTWL